MRYHINRYVQITGKDENLKVIEVYEGVPVASNLEGDAQNERMYFVEIPIPIPVQTPMGVIVMTTDNLSPLDAKTLEGAFEEAENRIKGASAEMSREMNKPSNKLVLAGA